MYLFALIRSLALSLVCLFAYLLIWYLFQPPVDKQLTEVIMSAVLPSHSVLVRRVYGWLAVSGVCCIVCFVACHSFGCFYVLLTSIWYSVLPFYSLLLLLACIVLYVCVCVRCCCQWYGNIKFSGWRWGTQTFSMYTEN